MWGQRPGETPEGSRASSLPAPQLVFTCPGGSMVPLPWSRGQQWDLQALLMAVPQVLFTVEGLWWGRGGCSVSCRDLN